MRDINIDFSFNKYDSIYNKIPFKIENNLEKRLSEKELTVSQLSDITSIKKGKINDLLENKFHNISIKDLLIISFILGVNPDNLVKLSIFNNDKKTNEYSQGFIEGLYYAIQIIKNLDSEINLDKLLSVYNKLTT